MSEGDGRWERNAKGLESNGRKKGKCKKETFYIEHITNEIDKHIRGTIALLIRKYINNIYIHI